METQSRARQIAFAFLASILWLICAGLGLEVIYVVKELFYLLFIRLGGVIQTAEQLALLLVYLMAVLYLVFIIGTTEYHRLKWGRYESWRLFGLSLSVELSLLLLYKIL